jgi:hypothetical protein
MARLRGSAGRPSGQAGLFPWRLGGHRVLARHTGSVDTVLFETMFVLLFPVRAAQAVAGFGDGVDGLETFPVGEAQARMDQLRETEIALLGSEYADNQRITRQPVGRVRLPAQAGAAGPDHGDLFLVSHTAGAALWECWIPVPDQPLDAPRFIEWLRSDGVGSPAALLRERIAAFAGSGFVDWEEGFPFTILRRPGEQPPLDLIIAEHGADLVQLLYLDRSNLAFKAGVVEEELGRDFCLRQGGISLLSQRGALDLRVGDDRTGSVESPAESPAERPVVLPPRSALPLLISIELLLLERTVLRLFHERLTETGTPASVSHLLVLKAEVLDGLEEYRGAVAESNRFSTEVTAYGQQVLGLDVLYRTLSERLESVTFEITTRYQQTTNLLQFSLTVVLGALQASSVAAVVAAVHYGNEPLAVLSWAAAAGLAAATAITLLLRRRLL